MKLPRGMFSAAVLLLSGCADFGAPISGGAPSSAQDLRFQELDTRLAEVTRKVDNLKLSAQTKELSRLESEMRGLRGEVETLRYDLDTREKRARDLYQDIDRRLQKIENESHPAKLALEPRIANVPPVPVSQEEEAAYVQAFDQLKAGLYDEALVGFNAQLERWPQGRYAVNALYWTGETYAARREHETALRSFRLLLERFPASDKAPDALFKIGQAQIELKQKDEARATLQKVIADYPNSNAATLARQRLEQLK